MKLIPIILSVILASSALGYGIQAYAQAAAPLGATPCTASQPCAKICGDHPCAPGEVYTPSMAVTNASSTKAVAKSTNSTGSPNISTQVNIGTNVTATKTTNGTQNTTSSIATSTMTNGTMTGKMTNGTMTTSTMPMASTPPSPNAQITAGAQPANVKCMSGYYLVINNANSRPACVTQNTMSILEARGWGHAAP